MRTQRIEGVLLGIGVAFLSLYGTARVQQSLDSRAAIKAFENGQGRAAQRYARSELLAGPQFSVDSTLWSRKRIEAYNQSLTQNAGVPLAVLRIPKIGLEAPVFEGTDDLVLNRGVGWITGTSHPGDNGNVALAGHRDGFFRRLKDVQLGDRLELITPRATTEFVVDKLQIVDPQDVSVLRSTDSQTLTLVTCFPFYYVGHAPERFIVRATAANLDGPGRSTRYPVSEMPNKEEHQQ